MDVRESFRLRWANRGARRLISRGRIWASAAPLSGSEAP